MQDGREPSPELLAQYRQSLGLDDPVIHRYLRWWGGVVRGDLGTSFLSGRPVSQMIAERVIPTMVLSATALVTTTLLGVSLGIFLAAAGKQSVDLFARVMAGLLAAVPSFCIALVLIAFFGVQAKILPVAGYGTWQHLVMPTLALAAGPTMSTLRLTRGTALEILGQDFIRTARSKGLAEPYIALQHIMPCISPPIISLIGVRFGHLLAGTVIVEALFAWPGMGTVLVTAISGRDLPVIGGYLLVTGIPVILANTIADIVSHLVDPRVRLGSGRGL
jgi:peptide/nickel transport system permease protein